MKTLSRRLTATFKTARPKSAGQLQRMARHKAQRLAATLYVELEILRGETGVNVWPTKAIDDDPFDGDHYAHCWEDAVVMLKAYADLPPLLR